MKGKKFTYLILAVMLIFSLTGCNNSNQELLTTPFVMEVHETYMNGAYHHGYPEKIFNTDELFNIMNTASGEGPFEKEQPVKKYHIEMINGTDFTEFEIWTDGTITMKYNFLSSSEFYLTPEEYDSVLKLIET